MNAKNIKSLIKVKSSSSVPVIYQINNETKNLFWGLNGGRDKPFDKKFMNCCETVLGPVATLINIRVRVTPQGDESYRGPK